jgi:hypothetical protein
MNGSAEIRSYRDLIVWQKAITLTKGIYQTTANFLIMSNMG